MKFVLIYTLFSIAFSTGASTASAPGTYTLEEKRTSTRRSWKRSERVDPHAILPVRIGLTQSNLESIYEHLMVVSHPDSPNFGNHRSAEEIREMYAPSSEAIESVRNWLLESEISPAAIVHSENKGWFALDIPAWQAETLFQAKYHEYDNLRSLSEKVKVGCDEYHVPEHLRRYIDYVTPGVTLSPSMIKSRVDIKAKRTLTLESILSHLSAVLTKVTQAVWKPPQAAMSLPAELQGCGRNITPACIRALYGLPGPTGLRNDSKNSLGIFQSEKYRQEDLNLYFAKYAPQIPQGTHPVLDSIDGGTTPSQADDEPHLPTDGDIVPSRRRYRKLRGAYPYNTFVDALDGSYCTFSAYGVTGDDSEFEFDQDYPDPAVGGYKGERMCGAYKPTTVISISYGYTEIEAEHNYTKRQCNEFAKLGQQGVTIVWASGDYGVSGGSGVDSDGESGCLGANETVYNIPFPTCPHILSVGATRLWDDQTVYGKESALEAPEFGPEEPTFSSSGGFSNYFSRPDYQSSAISTYFKNHDPGHPYYVAKANATAMTNIGEHDGLYNRAGRGIPDVFLNGTDHQIYGISVSAPLFASIITLINEERTAIGKGPVGFINPTLYKHPKVFNDIVNGSNANCGSSGFSAVSGWDPITGLGTPIYPKLLALMKSLP